MALVAKNKFSREMWDQNPETLLLALDTCFEHKTNPIRHYIKYKQNLYLKKYDIEIIIPVYNALEYVKKSLISLKKNTCGLKVHIILVNDCSDQETTEFLRDFCEQDSLFTLLENPSNYGYTKSINRGIKASTAPFIILLNSDTIVTKNWLMKMIQCMNSKENIGIVGPLSNNALFQNVPFFQDKQGNVLLNNMPEDEFFIENFAHIVESASLHTYPLLRFLNGFCFMIRREVIDTIGIMDEEHFPIGYGEEKDFCVRASNAGFLAAVADDTFIFHAKAKSFGQEKRILLTEQSEKILRQKHNETTIYLFMKHTWEENKALDVIRKRIQRQIDKEIDSL